MNERTIKQVSEAGDGDSLDDAQIFADGLSKQPSGPETGFQGTALMGGGGGRRPSPPLPAPSSSGGGGTIDVEAEIAAAEAAEAAAAASADKGAFVSCRRCTYANTLPATKCLMCDAELLVDP